jgi:hypothetical protein
MQASFFEASTTFSSLNAPALREAQGPQPSLVKNSIMALPSFRAPDMAAFTSPLFQPIFPPSCEPALQAIPAATASANPSLSFMVNLGNSMLPA